jgi:hypothetical protein
MNKRFTTIEFEKKMRLPLKIGIKLIIVGVVFLFFKDYNSINNIRSIGAFGDSFFFLTLGLILLIHSTKKDKELKGSFIEFRNNGFAFKSRLKEYQTDNLETIESINIKIDFIEILTKDNNVFKIFLEDYIDYKDKKAIKMCFQQLKELKTISNN